MSDFNTTASRPARSVQRLRHPLRARLLDVLQVQRISPHFIRVTLGGAALQGFHSASFDDHLKLMLPLPGQPVTLPHFGEHGPEWPEGAALPSLRDYTPRRYNAATDELDVEFLLHGTGLASSWAAQAAPGQQVGIGGPRGSFVVPVDYDWHLLIGDATALPAIARRLEELPASTQALVVVQLDDAADRRELPSASHTVVQWIAPGADALADAVQALQLPDGEGYAWAAGEARAMASVRRVLVGHHGLDKDHIRAAAYWKRGTAAHHENLSD